MEPSLSRSSELGIPIDSVDGVDHPLNVDLFSQTNQHRFLILTANNLRDGILAASSKTSSTSIQEQEQEMINCQRILNENEMIEKSLHKLAGRPENSDRSLLGSVPEPPAPSDPVAAETAAAEVASSAAVSAISDIELAKRQSLLNILTARVK